MIMGGDCRKTTQARMREEDSRTLREIAAAFGYYVQRGIGAHTVGNTTTMLECLARRWRDDPEGTRRILAPLLERCDKRKTGEAQTDQETSGGSD
jgi:hypothetical protein